MALTVAGVEFKDVRVAPKEWFASLKRSGKSPSEQLPFMEFDGNVLTQSKVILSYIGKEHNLAPEGNLKQAQADMLANAISDLEDKLTLAFYEKDQERKEKLLRVVNDEIIPRKCRHFEKFLSANTKQGFFFGDKLTYADIAVFAFLNSYYLKGNAEEIPEQLKEYPALYAWYELVRTQPKIQEWLKKSPPGLIPGVFY
ncbi:hypothetical protein ACROYT_G031581 [Oculina patagonica]